MAAPDEQQHESPAVARLAIFCAPADQEIVHFLCGDLTQAQGALLVFADGVPQNGGDVLHILQRAGQALNPQPLRVDFALLFARDELRLCKVELRGMFGDNSVSLVVAELARRVGARTELQRACLGSMQAPKVFDAFAGWGMDAFSLVGEGAIVHCVEQQPALCALLRDAQRRVPAQLAARLTVHCGDALGALRRTQAATYDVIYLDPMFAARKKGALPNKRLQFLAELCESSTFDLAELVDLALSRAGKQVVLKRRKRDPLLATRAPDRQVVGASVRYDIYDSV